MLDVLDIGVLFLLYKDNIMDFYCTKLIFLEFRFNLVFLILLLGLNWRLHMYN